MFVLAFLQAAPPAESTSSCLTFIITWAPFAFLIIIWALYMRRLGYFSKRGGYLKRTEDHMERVEKTLGQIEEHLRKLAERDRPE